jgi:hypothetical protein
MTLPPEHFVQVCQTALQREWEAEQRRETVATPLSDTPMREPDEPYEEVAVLRAGLKLDHDEGKGQDVVKDT